METKLLCQNLKLTRRLADHVLKCKIMLCNLLHRIALYTILLHIKEGFSIQSANMLH